MEIETKPLIQLTPKTGMNEILIRRKDKIILFNQSVSITENNLSAIGAFLKNFEALGYTFSKEVIQELLTFPTFALHEQYVQLYKILSKKVGADKVYTPMYPNFPKQVMEASDAELYVNAIIHYFGNAIGLRLIPRYDKEIRSPLLEAHELRVIGLSSEMELHEIFTNLMQSKTSISPQDKEDLKSYLEYYSTLVLLPKEFNHKEVMTFTLSIAMNTLQYFDLSQYLKTATDVLRFATALSEGDVSLASNTKFISFGRHIRRVLLQTLESSKTNILEDMLLHSGKWLRLGERLHPGDFASKYPKTIQIFSAIRNDVDYETFNSKVEKYIETKQLREVVKLLKTRPGVFARRLDHLFRIAMDGEDSLHKLYAIIQEFGVVAHEVATPVLLQIQNHFKYRDVRGSEYRIFFPKGSIAKMQVIPNELEILPSGISDHISKICEMALWNRFKELESLGNVYIDPKLKNYVIPFSQRSASNAMKTLVRGTRIPLEKNKSTVRFFMWWTNIFNEENPRHYDQIVDLDLSAIMYDDLFRKIGHVSYTNLRENYAYHSGDLTSAPNGAAEFIDINFDEFREQNLKGRYVVMNVFSYSGQKFSEVECFAGWMEREQVQSGEIFDPKTVKQRFDMNSETKILMPLIIDLKEREVIWLDLSVTPKKGKQRNLEENLDTMAILLQSIVKWKKPNLYDLFRIHAEARGTLIDMPDYAQFIFSTQIEHDVVDLGLSNMESDERIRKIIKSNVTPFDVEKIMSEFL